MSIGFPTLGLVANQTTYQKGDHIWQWTGSAWKLISAASTPKFYSGSTAPSYPSVGDTWYKTGTDVMYEYVYDGYTRFWLAQGAGTNLYSNATVTTLPATDNFSQFLLMGM